MEPAAPPVPAYAIVTAPTAVLVEHILSFYPVGSYLFWRTADQAPIRIVGRINCPGSRQQYENVPLRTIAEADLSSVLPLGLLRCALPAPAAPISPHSASSGEGARCRDPSVPPPTSVARSLPTDLWTLIISRLPFDSVMALRRVCRVRFSQQLLTRVAFFC